jgi:hypothetical protein
LSQGIDVCLNDWKNGHAFYINGIPLTQIMGATNIPGNELQDLVTEDVLKELWNDHLIIPLDKNSEQSKKLFDYMAKYFHQKGVLCAMRNCLNSVAGNQGYMVSSARERVDFVVKDGYLYIKDNIVSG